MANEDQLIDVPIESIPVLANTREVEATADVLAKLKATMKGSLDAMIGKHLSPRQTAKASFKAAFPQLEGDYVIFYSGIPRESLTGTLHNIELASAAASDSVYPEVSRNLLGISAEAYHRLLANPEFDEQIKLFNKAHELGHHYTSIRYRGNLYDDITDKVDDLTELTKKPPVNIYFYTDEEMAEMRRVNELATKLGHGVYSATIMDEALAIQNSFHYLLQKDPESIGDMLALEYINDVLLLTYTSRTTSGFCYERIYDAYRTGSEQSLYASGILPHNLAKIILATKDPTIFDKIGRGELTKADFLVACADGLQAAFADPIAFVTSISEVHNNQVEDAFVIRLDQHNMEVNANLRELITS